MACDAHVNCEGEGQTKKCRSGWIQQGVIVIVASVSGGDDHHLPFMG